MKAVIKNLFIECIYSEGYNDKDELQTFNHYYLNAEAPSGYDFNLRNKEFYFIDNLSVNVDGRKHIFGLSDILQGLSKGGYISYDNDQLCGVEIVPTEKLIETMKKVTIETLRDMYNHSNTQTSILRAKK